MLCYPISYGGSTYFKVESAFDFVSHLGESVSEMVKRERLENDFQWVRLPYRGFLAEGTVAAFAEIKRESFYLVLPGSALGHFI